MSIYDKLVQKNIIKKERFRKGPTRVREKVQGWMWEAEYEVITTHDKKFVFYMWHHFHDDDSSSEWKPTIQEIKDLMFCKFVPCGTIGVSPSWHTVLADGVYYISKRGFFGYENIAYQEEVEKQIKNGEWKTNPDIEILL